MNIYGYTLVARLTKSLASFIVIYYYIHIGIVGRLRAHLLSPFRVSAAFPICTFYVCPLYFSTIFFVSCLCKNVDRESLSKSACDVYVFFYGKMKKNEKVILYFSSVFSVQNSHQRCVLLERFLDCLGTLAGDTWLSSQGSCLWTEHLFRDHQQIMCNFISVCMEKSRIKAKSKNDEVAHGNSYKKFFYGHYINFYFLSFLTVFFFRRNSYKLSSSVWMVS